MIRSSFIVTLVLAIVATAMVAGSVCARPVPIEYHRVLVPSDRPDLWPTRNERYIPLPEKEFQKLLKAANRDDAKSLFSSADVKITSADYEIRLQAGPETTRRVSRRVAGEGSTRSPVLPKRTRQRSSAYTLSGQARLEVVRTSEKTADTSFLSLGPAILSVKDLMWEKEKQPIETGVDRHGQLIAQVDRSGVARFDFTAKNRSTKSGELRFNLYLPRSTRSTVSLVLDPAWEVSVPSGLLLGREVLEEKNSADSKQKSPADPQQIRWTIAPTLGGRLQLLLTEKKDASTQPEIPEVSESFVYEFSPRGLKLRGTFRLNTKSGELPERLRIALEKPLTPVSARLGEKQVKWLWESEKDGRAILSVVLPKSRPSSETLYLEAVCAIKENDDWQLPRIIPEKVLWRSGEMNLLISSPLSIGKLVPQGCVRTKVRELSERSGRSVELTLFRPDGTATVSLGWEKHLPVLSSMTMAELSSVGITVDQTLRFTTSSEDCFELSATVHPDWIIDSVESLSGGVIADWRVEQDEKSEQDKKGKKGEQGSDAKLKIQLGTALSKDHGPLRLRLLARHIEPESPLRKRLGLKDLVPVEFEDVFLSPENQFVAITTVDPYSVTYRDDTYVDPVTTSDVTGLFSQLPAGKLFRDNANAARLKILLTRQRPVYAATVDMVATVTEKKLVESYRFRCEPEASYINRLLVHLSCNEGKGPIHFVPNPTNPYFSEKQPGSDDEGKTFQTLSPQLFSAAKITRNKHGSAGMNSNGETWVITLKTPQSEPFEIYAVRVSNHADLEDHTGPGNRGKGSSTGSEEPRRKSILPRTICPSLAAMPEAIEHHASLQIETTDAMRIGIGNQRLSPIPLKTIDSRKIEKRRAAFEYETTDAMTSSRYPSISLTVDRPSRNPLLVWQCIVQTAYGSDGEVKTTACYRLENQGAARLRLTMPKNAPRLRIIDVALDGEYVQWVPEYDGSEEAGRAGNQASSETDAQRRLVAMNIDLPRTKRLSAVTVNYSYDNHSLGISTRHRLVAPKPDCEVVSVDWRLLVPPGYESPDYVAMKEMPTSDARTTRGKASPCEDTLVLSPRRSFCWRTRLFGPVGRSISTRPFNPLSYDSWAGLFDGVEPKAFGSESNPGDASTGMAFPVEDYPDWNVYRFHASTFDYLPSVRIEHRDSLESFRWGAFLVTVGLILWPISSRWVRRLTVAITAALGAILLPSFFGCIASGIFMGVLVGLLAIWLWRSGTGRSGVRRIDAPEGPGSISATTVRYAPSVPTGSTATQIATGSWQMDKNADEEKTSPAEDSTGTNIAVGKPIDDSTPPISPQTGPKPVDEAPEPPSTPSPTPSPPRRRPGGSTTIRRTTTLWLMAITLLLSGSARGDDFTNDFMDDFPGPESFLDEPGVSTLDGPDVSPVDLENLNSPKREKTERARPDVAPIRWPILVPAKEKEDGSLSTGSMVYLPEPFFHSLEKLSHRQAKDRDRWLMKDLALRAVLRRSASDETIEPSFLFFTAEVSLFSETAELQLPLDKKEVGIKENRALLDGRPVVPRWAEDGESLFIPVAGRGAHQLELTLVPLPESHVTRWNEKRSRDESGFRVTMPRFPKTKIELTYPADVSELMLDGSLRSAKDGTADSEVIHPHVSTTRRFISNSGLDKTAQTTFTSEGRLSVWWPDDLSRKQSRELPQIDELLFLDITPDVVVLQADWSFAPERWTASSGNSRFAFPGSRSSRRLHEMVLSVDPRLGSPELTDGFTLEPIPDYPEKRRLRWTRTMDPPSHVRAKFTLEKTGGIGQFLPPQLRLEPDRVARRWVAVRVAPGLDYQIQLPERKPPLSTQPLTVSPDEFMALWQKKWFLDPDSDISWLMETEPQRPDFVIDDRRRPDWSFRTGPKSVHAEVASQTLCISYGETSASVDFEAKWSSGSCDMPEPSLRVPENIRIRSVWLIDDGMRKEIAWTCTEKGLVHLATGLLSSKQRTIRLEGTFDVPDKVQAVAPPVLFLVGAEQVPVHLGIYRKPDAQVKLSWTRVPQVSKSSLLAIDDPQLGRPIQWLDIKPLETPSVEVTTSPNRPKIMATQVVTIHYVGKQQEMAMTFDITPDQGVVDEIAIFVPENVVGPFRTEPTLSLVGSHEGEKGRTLVFRPQKAIAKRQIFKISGQMEGEEVRIPDVRLSGVDDLQRYVILPLRGKRGEYQNWQTRLLNRVGRSKRLKGLVPDDPRARIYSIVRRQWMAEASTVKKTRPLSSASLADIQVRWQEDGTYLGAAAFDLKPAGNRSCRLVVPEGLTILDTRIGGIPVSLTKAPPAKAKPGRTTEVDSAESSEKYEVRFASSDLPQRIEVLFRNEPQDSDSTRTSGTIQKKFKAPFLDVKIKKTRWTVQGPSAYNIVGDFETLDKEEVFAKILQQEAKGIVSLTPFLTQQASLGSPVRWTTDGFQGTWEPVWESHRLSPTASLVPTVLLLLIVAIFIFTRPVRIVLISVFYRHGPLCGIGLGLFWWLFLSPSVLGWVIISAFLVVIYRTRRVMPTSDSTVIRIG